MPNDCCTSCCIGDCECITIQPVQYSLLRQICASSMGSIISTLALNPITVIKVRLQNLHANNSYVSESILHKASGVSPIRGVINTVLKERGVAGFWAGTRTGIAMSVPNTVLYMSIYEHFKISFAEDTRLASVRAITPALAGALARLVSVTIISPLEMLRTIQTGGSGDPIRAIARSIVREDGIKGLYRGWASSVLRDCPFSAIYWFGFEALRPIYSNMLHPIPTQQRSSSSSSSSSSSIVPGINVAFPASVTFLSGATSGMVSAIATHPFDVLKTRQQVSAWPSSSTTTSTTTSTVAPVGETSADVSSSSILHTRRPVITLAGIFRAEGVSALYRGLSMRMATVIPASAIMVTIYESIKKLDI